MIPQANITAWRALVPWPDDAQVEQDLVLSRALVELFNDPNLAGKIALRGGTALNKLFIQPPSRYSEDIDLVQTQTGPIGTVLDAVRKNLDPWLGAPNRSRAKGGVTLIYRFDSEIAPVRPLRLKIETNTREHFTVYALQHRSLAMEVSMQNPNHDLTDQAIQQVTALLLPAGDAARLLNISERHFYKLHSGGRLPRPVRLGRSVRWRAKELQEWLDAGAPSHARWENMRGNGR